MTEDRTNIALDTPTSDTLEQIRKAKDQLRVATDSLHSALAVVASFWNEQPSDEDLRYLSDLLATNVRFTLPEADAPLSMLHLAEVKRLRGE